MKTSEHLTELFAALAKAQGQIVNAEKNRTNTYFKSNYADLASCWDACRKPLSDNGLCLIQMPRITDQGWTLETMLAHESGQWLSDEMTMPVSKQDAQGYGISITYLRRYALCAVLGIAAEDEDGDDSSGSSSSTKKQETTKKKDEDKLPAYDQSLFEKNFPGWEKVIKEGKKTPAGMVALVSTKGTLTDAQRMAIMSVKPADTMTYAAVSDALQKAGDLETLDIKADLIRMVSSEQHRTELNTIYHDIRAKMVD